MGIGAGVLLIIIGLILLFAIHDVHLAFLSVHVLGIILVAGGILIIVLVLVLNAQRTRTRHVQENRYDGTPPPVL